MAITPSLSPTITVREIDLTGVVPNVQSTTGVVVGNFNWGPIYQRVLVGNEAELAAAFGSPDTDTAVDFLSAAQYLRYSNSLFVTRAHTGSTSNATANTDSVPDAVLILNDENYDSQKGSFGADSSDLDTGIFVARYAGDLGNSIKVSVLPQAGTFASWTYASEFTGAPATSEWATSQGGATNDEVHIVVVDADGKITGTPGTILEKWEYLSVARGAKTTDGSSNYFPDVLNSGSQYVRFGYFDNVRFQVGTNWGTTPGTATDYSEGVSWTENGSTVTLVGGTDSSALGTAEYALGFDLYEDRDTVQVDFLICPDVAVEADNVTVVNDLVGIATARADCVAVASPNRAAIVNNASPVTASTTTTDQYTGSSYLIVDNNYLKVYDKYNDQYIFVPASSSTAGIMAATDVDRGAWFSPAGARRGQYLGITAVSYNATKTERDTLYNAGVNPVATVPQVGTILYGDKTKESRPSAFDRINVRRLFLVIERAVARAAQNVLFEFNDQFTRAEFVGVIEPFLREIQGRRGITDFRVVCDETNNPPAVVDRNELVASVFIKPARSINYVTLNFVATRTGVDFEEVVGTV